MDNGDWLQDPLRILKNGSYIRRQLKNSNEEQNTRWWSFHFVTRLKLDGADYFCRQALGASSRPDDLGLPLLAHRLTEWYLDAFFFELMAAYDTLLQELNIVYNIGLKPKNVRWYDKNKNNFMEKLPEEIFKSIVDERKKDWFCKVQWFRNTATHHYTVPLSSGTTFIGDNLSYVEHDVRMNYFDSSGKLVQEDIKHCTEYLHNMVNFISSVWEMMAEEFE
jgi:hypothetical protein